MPEGKRTTIEEARRARNDAKRALDRALRKGEEGKVYRLRKEYEYWVWKVSVILARDWPERRTP